ncbi:MAG: hypothetical protein MUF49_24475 [Oculatellaceae cyanobacterium Prado106]|jgi:hypothetical protein|nr:hypothetical protein [Oculatellaceae cyanobacterium Prado106]
MAESTPPLSIPKTPDELEKAIQHYRNSDLHDQELFEQWQAIRLAALEQKTNEPAVDPVPGEASY